MLGQLDPLTDHQLTFQCEPDSWSLLQVAQHVLSAEQRSVGVLLEQDGRPNDRRTLRQRVFYVLVWVVMKTGLKVKNPTRVNPDDTLTLEEIRTQWSELRGRLKAHLQPLETADLGRAAFKHPISGPFDLEEGLLFLDRHTRHHLKQLERIQGHARFPAA